MTEEQMQAECARWFWNEFYAERRMLFHVDNNSQNDIVGARKKALGVCRGPSDFVLVTRKDIWFIEMKLPWGSQSDEQKDFEQKLIARGKNYVIIRSVDDFKMFVIEKLTER